MDDAGARAIASFVAAGWAEIVTLPLDCVKARLQIQTGVGTTKPYTGVAEALSRISREEGVAALWYVPRGRPRRPRPPCAVRTCSTTVAVALKPRPLPSPRGRPAVAPLSPRPAHPTP